MVCFDHKLQLVQTTYTILFLSFAHLPQVGLLQILHVATVALVHFLPLHLFRLLVNNPRFFQKPLVVVRALDFKLVYATISIPLPARV